MRLDCCWHRAHSEIYTVANTLNIFTPTRLENKAKLIVECFVDFAIFNTISTTSFLLNCTQRLVLFVCKVFVFGMFGAQKSNVSLRFSTQLYFFVHRAFFDRIFEIRTQMSNIDKRDHHHNDEKRRISGWFLLNWTTFERQNNIMRFSFVRRSDASIQ